MGAIQAAPTAMRNQERLNYKKEEGLIYIRPLPPYVIEC